MNSIIDLTNSKEYNKNNNKSKFLQKKNNKQNSLKRKREAPKETLRKYNNNNNNNIEEDLTSSPNLSKKKKRRQLSSQFFNQEELEKVESYQPRMPTQKKLKKKHKKAKRKLVIKPFKKKPSIPNTFFKDSWEKLKKAVQDISQKRESFVSEEELYQSVRELCVQKYGSKLLGHLISECEKISIFLSNSIGETSKTVFNSESFLKYFENVWVDYCYSIEKIETVFLYLDRTYIMNEPNLKPFWLMGLGLFRNNIMMDKTIQKKIINSMLTSIELERKGFSIDNSVMRSLARMLKILHLYIDIFQDELVNETINFYKIESEKRVNENSIPNYLNYVSQTIKNEVERSEKCFLLDDDHPFVVDTTRNVLIRNHSEKILEKGFFDMMKNNNVQSLKILYLLFKKVEKEQLIKSHLSKYVRTEGIQIVKDMDKDKDTLLIKKLLNFKEKIDKIYYQSFFKEKTFWYEIKSGFEHFINLNTGKTAELIAKYIDKKLRSSGSKSKGKNTRIGFQRDDEIEEEIEKALDLFHFTEGKDVFEAFYMKDLAKRLLLGKSASFDVEKSTISKLKTECGATFTQKLEGMFKDVDVSEDNMKKFRTCEKFKIWKNKNNIDVSIITCTRKYWPSYDKTEVILPNYIETLQKDFLEFYLEQFSSRKLDWIHSLGTCIMKAIFPKGGKKELQLSTLQGIVVLLFSEEDKLNFKEIHQKSGIEKKKLKVILQSLSLGKVRVLRKLPKGKEIDEDDTFFFNKEFVHKLYRIKVNQIQFKEDDAEKEATKKRILVDRNYMIDAACVKIMKTRKELSHKDLMTEIFRFLRFPTKASDIKKRIESLIEREYLGRTFKKKIKPNKKKTIQDSVFDVYEEEEFEDIDEDDDETKRDLSCCFYRYIA